MALGAGGPLRSVASDQHEPAHDSFRNVSRPGRRTRTRPHKHTHTHTHKTHKKGKHTRTHIHTRAHGHSQTHRHTSKHTSHKLTHTDPRTHVSRQTHQQTEARATHTHAHPNTHMHPLRHSRRHTRTACRRIEWTFMLRVVASACASVPPREAHVRKRRPRQACRCRGRRCPVPSGWSKGPMPIAWAPAARLE